jgi:hypothetical protein
MLLVASRIALREGITRDAEQFARDALRISEPIARGPDTSADVGEALLRLAQAQLAADGNADVHALLERSVRCLTNGLAGEHPLTVEARKLLGRR